MPITARRTIVSITTVALFIWQLAGCAVLPEKMSGFKEPTPDQQSNLDAATKYAQDVNGELLSLHDQYALFEAALIAGALGSGVAFGVATAFNGSRDLLAALGLAGGGLVAIDYASSAPQKIKVINEGRSEILCAMNTAPLLTRVSAAGPNPLPAGTEGNKFALMAPTAGAAGSSGAASAMFDLATSLQQVRPRAPMAMAFAAKPNAASLQAEAAANKTASASWNIVASQVTAMGIVQTTDYNTALQQVYEIVPPSPAQYLSMTVSDVAHSVFDLLDESNPSVSDVYNKAKAISPKSTANAQAAIQKAAASTQQAKSLVNSVQTVIATAAAASDVPAPDPNAVATKTAAANQTLDQNAQTLTVLGDMLQKAKDCKSVNSGVWNIGGNGS